MTVSRAIIANELGVVPASLESADWRSRQTWFLAGALAVCFLLQIHLVFAQPVNWDEFRFLADVHSHARGELSGAILTFQVHFFGWLPGQGNEIDQIHSARLVMLAFEAGTVGLVWLVARRFFRLTSAFLAALGYLSFSFVLQHGASFRFDPIATFLVMLCVWLLLARLSWLRLLLVASILAVATMVTVKVVLAFPLLVGIGIYRISESQKPVEEFARLAITAIASGVFLAALYAWHVSTLASPSTAVVRDQLGAGYAKALGEWRLFPSYRYLSRAAFENPLHWIVLGTGIVVTVRRLRAARGEALLLLCFVLPLLSVVFYRNAFPYFYAFMLAPAAILIGAAAETQTFRRWAWLVGAAWAAAAFIHHHRVIDPDANDQNHVVRTVHTLFPRPVAYIDRCSTISSFPQAGIFLSSWWLENYVAAGRPVLREMIARNEPVFVLVNSPVLTEAFGLRPKVRVKWSLLPEDRDALRSNYVHYWGPLWIAGKWLTASAQARATEVLIPGAYVVQSERPVTIDRQTVFPHQSVVLRKGRHLVASPDGPQRVLLRWGSQLPRLEASAPRELEFGRF